MTTFSFQGVRLEQVEQITDGPSHPDTQPTGTETTKNVYSCPSGRSSVVYIEDVVPNQANMQIKEVSLIKASGKKFLIASNITSGDSLGFHYYRDEGPFYMAAGDILQVKQEQTGAIVGDGEVIMHAIVYQYIVANA